MNQFLLIFLNPNSIDFSKIKNVLLIIEKHLDKNEEKEAIKILQTLVPEFSIDPQNKFH